MKYIPFLEAFVPRIKLGLKTMTTRNEKYGEPGDLLASPAGTLRLLEVLRVKLGEVAENSYREEGCASPEEFEEIWNRIHPKRGYHPDDWVWLHEFEAISGGDGTA